MPFQIESLSSQIIIKIKCVLSRCSELALHKELDSLHQQHCPFSLLLLHLSNRHTGSQNHGTQKVCL
jgi:hypothetical protein